MVLILRWIRWVAVYSLLICTTVGTASEMRTWRSAAGTELEAEFVALRAGQIVLRTKEGGQVAIDPTSLSEEDIAYVREILAAAQEAADEASEISVKDADDARLATFTSGQWSGAAAVYEHPNFVATMDNSGNWAIQPKDGGKAVGSPIMQSRGASYSDTNHKPRPRSINRKVVEYTQRPDRPLMQPQKIHLAGVLEDGVKFEYITELQGGRMTFEFRLQDPEGIEFPTRFSVNLRFAKTHDFPSGTRWEEIQAALEGYELIAMPLRGSSETISYRSTMANRAIKQVEVVSPWGPRRRILVEGPDGRGWPNAHLQNYSNNEPYRGFSVVRRSTQLDARGQTSTGILVLTIN